MVNPHTLTPIPFAGRGQTYHKNGNYFNGEYKKLINCEIDENNRIRDRRNIQHIYGSAATVKPYNFVGSLLEYAVFVTETEQIAVRAGVDDDGDISGETVALFPFSELPADAEIVSVFRYFDRNFYLAGRYVEVPSVKTEYYLFSADFGNMTPTQHPGVGVQLITGGVPGAFVKSFIFKERLWIFNEGKIYFSTGTDVTDFTLPSSSSGVSDGGFFTIIDTKIKDAIPLKDSIYVICDSAVYVITYSTSPNQNATVRLISSDVGGDSACVYEDQIYISKDNNVYQISSMNLSKVFDLQLGFTGPNATVGGWGSTTKMIAFDTYIIFLRRHYNTYPGTDRVHPVPNNLDDEGNAQEHVFFLNMTNGSIHAIDHTAFSTDAPGAPVVNNIGYISDAFYVPVERTSRNESFIYFLTNNRNGADTRGTISAMSTEVPHVRNRHVRDNILSNNGADAYLVPTKITIEIPSYSPDGLEYDLKRFRSLLITGKFPPGYQDEDTDTWIEYRAKLQISYDNNAYGAEIPLTGPAGDGVSNPPYPIRLPLNQRARSISLKFTSRETPSKWAIEDNDFLIEDLQLLWTPTTRKPIKRTQSTVGGLS